MFISLLGILHMILKENKEVLISFLMSSPGVVNIRLLCEEVAIMELEKTYHLYLL